MKIEGQKFVVSCEITQECAAIIEALSPGEMERWKQKIEEDFEEALDKLMFPPEADES